jgi:hypothetical protein
MDILGPEIEDLIRYEVGCSSDLSVDEYVERALSLLDAHQKWLTEHGAEKPAEL